MSNGWTDGKNRTLIYVLVASPRGIVFFKSVDAFAKVKNIDLLA